MRVLIIDDNNDFRQMLKLLFEEEGFEVAEADNGTDAIQMYKYCKPHAVVVDMKMPRINGITTLYEMMKIEPSVPMYILTAYGTLPDAVMAMQSGAIDFISKTSNPQDLVLRIKKTVRILQSKYSPPSDN